MGRRALHGSHYQTRNQLLPKHVTDDEIRTCLQAQDPAETCQNFIDLANAGGGSDNVTVIVGRFGQETRSVDETLNAMDATAWPQEPQEPVAIAQEACI